MRFSCIITLKDRVFSVSSEKEYKDQKEFISTIKQQIKEKYPSLYLNFGYKISHVKVI